MSQFNAIPVLYYHSVASHRRERAWSFLSCDEITFRKQMKYLYNKGYKTCDWNELYEHLEGKKRLPNNTIMIQFDDGFLDNWTVVFPIMKEYGFKFSVVVTPEFIDQHASRPFLEKTSEENIKNWWGYLSKEELIEMEASGYVDIQAHGYTHTWYPISDEIEDIYDGSQIVPWLFWNENPEEKPKWLTNNSLEKIPKGYPIFKNEKSLANLCAFLPNDEFVKACTEVYDPKLDKEKNFKIICELAEKFRLDGKLGRYETEEESLARLKKELLGTRIYLEKLLNKKIEYLVWPGGGNNKKVQELAFECGYKLISKGTCLNYFDSHEKKIFRVAAYNKFYPTVFNSFLNVMFLQLQIWRANGNKGIGVFFNFIKFLRKVYKK